MSLTAHGVFLFRRRRSRATAACGVVARSSSARAFGALRQGPSRCAQASLPLQRVLLAASSCSSARGPQPLRVMRQCACGIRPVGVAPAGQSWRWRVRSHDRCDGPPRRAGQAARTRCSKRRQIVPDDTPSAIYTDRETVQRADGAGQWQTTGHGYGARTRDDTRVCRRTSV
jgi:hypothetical protein